MCGDWPWTGHVIRAGVEKAYGVWARSRRGWGQAQTSIFSGYTKGVPQRLQSQETHVNEVPAASPQGAVMGHIRSSGLIWPDFRFHCWNRTEQAPVAEQRPWLLLGTCWSKASAAFLA